MPLFSSSPTPSTGGVYAGPVGHRELEKELSVTLYEQSSSLFERFVVGAIAVVSFTAIVLVLLIFYFVTRESLPVLFQETDNTRSGLVIKPEDVTTKTPQELAKFLQAPVEQVARLSPDVMQKLVASRNEEIFANSNPDTKVNTTTWRMLILPYQWVGYQVPQFIWQPVGIVEKYNIVPLFLGSLKISLVALLVAVPIALMSSIYISQLASSHTRETIKPVIELLAGIPSVVLGFLGLILFAPLLFPLFHAIDPTATPKNALVAGIAMALAVIPIIFTISEDALTAVPYTHKDAARAMGATDWHATISVVVPAALPGIFAAVVLGFGRAIGETMVVLIASGNAATMDLSIFQSARTVTATIAAELNEVAQGSEHYRILFLIGAILFLITFIGNIIADIILQRLKARLEGTAQVEEDPLRVAHELETTHLGSAVV